MKTLSIRQPWAWLILHGGKDIENRTWSTKYRGPLLIHAGKQPYDAVRVGSRIVPDALDTLLAGYRIGLPFVEGWAKQHGIQEFADVFPMGGIVGKVDLVGCVQNHGSKWAFPGCWHWVLANPEPVKFWPCKGKLGLFEVEL